MIFADHLWVSHLLAQLPGQGHGFFPGGFDGQRTGFIPVFPQFCGAELNALYIVDPRVQGVGEQVLELGKVPQGDDDGLAHKVPDEIAFFVVTVPVPRLDAHIVGLDVLGINPIIAGQGQHLGYDGVVLALGQGQVLVPGFHAQGQDHLVRHNSHFGVSGRGDEPGFLRRRRILCPGGKRQDQNNCYSDDIDETDRFLFHPSSFLQGLYKVFDKEFLNQTVLSVARFCGSFVTVEG